MNRIFIITFIIFSLLSCENQIDNSSKKVYHKNGKLAQETFCISDSTSIVYLYYESGNLHSLTSFAKQEKDGIYIAFYESGTVAERGFFRNNKEDGKWLYYSEDGLLIEKLQLALLSGESIAKECIYYTSEMNFDTTKHIRYVETTSFVDTIYNKEPYLLKLKLHQPYFKNGSMDITLVDDHEKYYNLAKIDTFENLVHCKGFEHLLQITKYNIGNNEINGVVINYDETEKYRIPYYFSQSFYVKELPK